MLDLKFVPIRDFKKEMLDETFHLKLAHTPKWAFEAIMIILIIPLGPTSNITIQYMIVQMINCRPPL